MLQDQLSKMEALKAALITEKDTLERKFKHEYSIILSKETERVASLKDKELQQMKINVEKNLNSQILKIKVTIKCKWALRVILTVSSSHPYNELIGGAQIRARKYQIRVFDIKRKDCKSEENDEG